MKLPVYVFLFFTIFFFSCKHFKKLLEQHDKEYSNDDKKIMLRKDTLNVVTMKDTMVIYESTCRGCAYENSTNFSIIDTSGIVELNGIITTDNNPSNVDGGSISKDLIIVPKKAGTTTFKLFKWYKEAPTAQDSANASEYKIEVKN